MKFNKGSELDKQIYKEEEPTWGCKSGVLDVEVVGDFINQLRQKGTIQKKLDFDHNPISEEDCMSGKKEFAHCGGCKRFVMEEGCTCGLIDIKDMDDMAGACFHGKQKEAI